MVIYVENLKESIRKQPEIINEFRKVTGYKNNIQKLYFYILAMNTWKPK